MGGEDAIDRLRSNVLQILKFVENFDAELTTAEFSSRQ